MNKISYNSNNDLYGFDWQKARKREIVVAVAFSSQPEVIETLEGPVRCETGDAIITGVRGKRWPVQRAVFEMLYKSQPPLLMGADGQYRSLPVEVEVARLTDSCRLELPGQQGSLVGKAGDWLVRKQDGSMGIVAGDIFYETYDLVK